MNKPNRQPNASVSVTPLVEDEALFVQQVWETTYSACLASILASRAGKVASDDKFLTRDIHRALDLSNIAKSAALSYIENGKKEAAKQEAAKAGDPLSRLVEGTEPNRDQP